MTNDFRSARIQTFDNSTIEHMAVKNSFSPPPPPKKKTNSLDPFLSEGSIVKHVLELGLKRIHWVPRLPGSSKYPKYPIFGFASRPFFLFLLFCFLSPTFVSSQMNRKEWVWQAFFCETRTEIATVKLEENSKCKGGGWIGRCPSHRSRSPKATGMNGVHKA